MLKGLTLVAVACVIVVFGWAIVATVHNLYLASGDVKCERSCPQGVTIDNGYDGSRFYPADNPDASACPPPP